FMNWDGTNWQSDSSITMYSHPGANANTPWSSSEWSTVEMGNGSFEIEPASYDGSGAPKSKLTNVSTSADGSGADLEANGGNMELVLDFGRGVTTKFTIHRPELTADVPSTANVTSGGKVTLNNAKLGGAVAKGDLYRALNEGAASCSAYNTTNRADMIIQPPSNPNQSEQWNCNVKQNSNCSGIANDLETACQLVSIDSEIQSYTDVNLDMTEPNKNDALSIGANFTAVQASITGINN
ncbi:MAG: hypothetical protein ABEN55_19475, partial [Bradymonadaceae bacterium]